MVARTLPTICLMFCASTVQSQTLTIAGGQTFGASITKHDSYRLELNFPLKPELWSNHSLALSLNHAFSLMTFRDKNIVNAFSWAPNLVLTSRNKSGIHPFAQLGFGIAYLSHDRFKSDVPTRYANNGNLIHADGTSDMGSHGQFESSVCFGLIYEQFSIKAQFYHYSNAGFSTENGGMNVMEVGISYDF